jgi:aerobic carbon-monoxide dehydrogenase large subunit
MPYVTEIPQRELGRLQLGHQETPSPLNPLGIKGAGEAGVIPVSALIASAVEDAMGIPIDAMPVTPDLLFGLINARTGGSGTTGGSGSDAAEGDAG